MSSHRPYRAALGTEKGLEEISKGKGTLFDPVIVDACLQVFHQGGFKFKDVQDGY
jgi:HD-GYP domain-containing protein (c-di-GMP phosphodiesterase class II)